MTPSQVTPLVEERASIDEALTSIVDSRDPKAYVHESDIHTEEYKDFRNWTLELG